MSLSLRILRPICLLLLFGWPLVASAQQPTPVTYGDGRRAQATRAELEASLVEIDKIASSPGYSGRLRESRRREAELIRERLEEGDLQVGDQIQLTVLGEERFSGTFLIGAGRVLSLPGMPDIPLRGVLRAETQAYLTEQLQSQLRDPQGAGQHPHPPDLYRRRGPPRLLPGARGHHGHRRRHGSRGWLRGGR
ncbi:MAG: polysaccharide biosynthesis/export family protein [Gemmatimonadales bacterium]